MKQETNSVLGLNRSLPSDLSCYCNCYAQCFERASKVQLVSSKTQEAIHVQNNSPFEMLLTSIIIIMKGCDGPLAYNDSLLQHFDQFFLEVMTKGVQALHPSLHPRVPLNISLRHVSQVLKKTKMLHVGRKWFQTKQNYITHFSIWRPFVSF